MYHTTSELPHTGYYVKIDKLRGVQTNDIINNDIKQFNYRPSVMKDQEQSHYFKKPSGSHPLARYSDGGYYDPSWESLENDRLQYHASLPASIISGVKNKSKYNVMVDAGTDNNYEGGFNDRNMFHQFSLNTDVGKGFEDDYGGIHDERRNSINETHGTSSRAYAHRINDPFYDEGVMRDYSGTKRTLEVSDYNAVDLNDVPIYPEAKPYIQREGIDWVSNGSKGRMPAGYSFSAVDTRSKLRTQDRETFRLTKCDKNDNANICAVLSEKELDDINKFLGIGEKKTKEGFLFSNSSVGTGTGVQKQADIMYMSALKVRANAICDYLHLNQAYKSWMSNWDLLEKNLKHGKLFERLSETDGDVAYVINKGDQVKFRIRDTDRYVPINVYQYVLYHEMAHMSTKELQHTPGFMKLLNIITLAGFECGFIDFKRYPSGYYTSNGTPILCKESMRQEVILGAKWLKEVNRGNEEYYDGIIAAVNSV